MNYSFDENFYLTQLANCIERGKVNSSSKIPADMIGQPGVEEYLSELLAQNIPPKTILDNALLIGMNRVGEKFRDGKIFIPDVLIAAKAMNAAMEILRPYIVKGDLKLKGKIILATVKGDLHNIGKNLVRMVLEGGGWEVIDLGIDVSSEKIIDTLNKNDVKAVGLSALLTTTMLNMKEIVWDIKNNFPLIPVAVGGAPLNQKFADEIKADLYSPDPQGMLDYLNKNFCLN
ncbi:Putative cobalamin binding protein [Ignavibacterium album JCM 16511]|uniref:Putative cobalamin binding protein n=1 Tax=Ignavibacterium album (strain DSM 19864 / JCM 16511 / NBRC 101810 / Mat9-16) TaxID=945713 RepID=I0AKM0_IGNAJ|nr:corrinoid protein [Ignavibacterium album]AFH49527.1 Putative cobalamin binding protein [Ignavibacterium album JCM 16511]